MLLKKNKYCITFFIIGGLISFALTYWLIDYSHNKQVSKKPLINAKDNLSQVIGAVNKETIIREEIYYKKCKHLIIREIMNDGYFQGLTLENLQDYYPKNQGWNIYRTDDNEFIFSRNIDDICPDDKQFRHIGVTGEFVAVFEGPIGVEGRMIDQLDIKVSQLPEEWQEKVMKGELDFSSEKELLEALDSIDEYE